jgi:hypothetical protein
MLNRRTLETYGIFVALSLLLFSAPIKAQTGGSVSAEYKRRAAAREGKRWTLEEWLQTRDRNRMMDLWLALNSPSPYEGAIALSRKNYQIVTDPASGADNSYGSYSGEITAYASIVGLTLEHENNPQEGFYDTTGIFNLRLLGHCIQCTALTLHYGLRTRYLESYDPEIKLAQTFSQATLQLYLFRYFGIEGVYRSYQPITEERVLGKISQETLLEGGVFIDYAGLRVFGNWYRESQKLAATDTTNLNQTSEKNGVRAGFRLYF